MNHDSFPKTKTLVYVWLGLMVATISTMIAGKVTDTTSIGIFWMVILMAATMVKSTLILGFYLDLKSASGNWFKGFVILTLVIVLIILGLYSMA